MRGECGLSERQRASSDGAGADFDGGRWQWRRRRKRRPRLAPWPRTTIACGGAFSVAAAPEGSAAADSRPAAVKKRAEPYKPTPALLLRRLPRAPSTRRPLLSALSGCRRIGCVTGRREASPQFPTRDLQGLERMGQDNVCRAQGSIIIRADQTNGLRAAPHPIFAWALLDVLEKHRDLPDVVLPINCRDKPTFGYPTVRSRRTRTRSQRPRRQRTASLR